jgi:hypothetical protein
MMREKTKRDRGTRPSPSSRDEWEKLFEGHFGQPWDASSREQILAALRKRDEGFLLMREIERVLGGIAALKRLFDGLPPPENEPPPIFGHARKHDERYLLVSAFEEGLVRFASRPVSPRALAVVSLLMGYEHDSHKEDVLERAQARMKTTRRRYRQERAPTTPETMQRLARARAIVPVLEAPLREAFDTLMRLGETL